MQTVPRAKKRGLGCFSGIFVLFVVGSVAVLGFDALFAPWSFYLGGTFHIIPYWQGWGRMHTKSSGDYLLFVRLTGPGSAKYHAYMRGDGELCTPRGERIYMRMGANMDKHVGTDLEGQPVWIYMYHRPRFWGNPDRRPSLDFHGKWQNPDIVMNDGGTLLTEFTPDGTLYAGAKRPAKNEVLQLTLKQGSRDGYDAACAMQKR